MRWKTTMELREDKAEHLKAAEEILERADKENRGMTAEEQAKADEHIERARSAATAIKVRDATAEIAEPVGRQVPPQAIRNEPGRMPDPTRCIMERSDFAGVEWRDAKTGQAIPVLRRDQRLSDLPGASGRSDLHPDDLCLGRALRAIVRGSWQGAELEHRAMSEIDSSAGGFAVPQVLSSRLIDKVRNRSVVLALGAQTVPMTSNELVLARVESDATFTTKAENVAWSATDMSLSAVNLMSKTLGGYVELSQELADDMVNSAIIEDAMAAALAVEVDRQALAGDGGAEMTGLANYTGIQEIAVGGSIDWDSVLDLHEDLMDENFEPTGFATTPLLSTALRKLKVNSEANHYAMPPDIVRGWPWMTSNQCTAGELYLADWTRAVLGVRHDVRIEITTQSDSAFKKHQVWVKAVWRGDVGLTHSKAFGKLSGATA